MKISNGIDIIKIDRVKNIINNEKLMNNIFTTNELIYIKSRNNDIDTIAGMFSAKESFLKCMKKGLEGYPFNEIEILHDGYCPYINLLGNTKKEIEKENLSFSVSISHDGEYAISYVISYSS